MREEDRDWVSLVPQSIEQGESLEFSIEDITIDSFNDSREGPGIRLSLVLGRQNMGEIFSTFLPSTLMLVLSHFSSTLACPFKVAILINLASLLVVTMLSCSSFISHPSKSNFNMADIWLLICYFTIAGRIVHLMLAKRAESKTIMYKTTKVNS